MSHSCARSSYETDVRRRTSTAVRCLIVVFSMYGTAPSSVDSAGVEHQAAVAS